MATSARAEAVTRSLLARAHSPSALTSADFHGAEVEVVRSSCPSRVGIRGIVVKDSKYVFEVVTRKNALKMVPKEGTVFRVEIPVSSDGPGGGVDAAEGSAGTTVADDRTLIFEIHGDQFKLRSADRANKKFKVHYLPNL
ncbi:ribonuclease P protein subunit p29 [Magnaporthiopsis poae ATCC 64411]|uniref:Ribonuclease P protein subunit p29 n=1 Tax=Magnaporthiopsis poae (strain ATCC 64411 / 73-15) TaxID=644358 RepID=A0A0C4DNN4_MAGP6|nr:ribonuclease P protein subunit p29 [Magnaporthiopsis poae ATCC 64411]